MDLLKTCFAVKQIILVAWPWLTFRIRFSWQRYGLSEESIENTLVNLHGLLGEPDAVQIEIATENLEEGSQFVYDNVAYQVTRTIMDDVEHPLVYVMVLDIFADS